MLRTQQEIKADCCQPGSASKKNKLKEGVCSMREGINMFDRDKSDVIFTETLDLLDALNTRDGRFDYADYVALHNNISALYDSFMDVDDAIDRIAAYEGIGMEPDEIQARIDEIKNEIEELKATLAIYRGFDGSRLHQIIDADRDGRLIVLPSINLYKTLYWIWGDEIMPVKYMGLRYGTVAKGEYHVVCRMITKKDRTFYHRGKLFTYKAGDELFFFTDDIGKTVFLTRKEAEKALGGVEP
jgi:hypothetical protein